MTANTFNNIRSIGHSAAIGAAGKADTVLVNSNTVLTDTSFSRAIFNLPSRYIKTVKDGSNVNDTDYTFYKADTVTIANNGTFTVTTDSDETFPTGTGTLSSTQKNTNFYLSLIDAANTALAPDFIPSTKWSKVPTPPDAITGILTFEEIFFINSIS